MQPKPYGSSSALHGEMAVMLQARLCLHAVTIIQDQKNHTGIYNEIIILVIDKTDYGKVHIKWNKKQLQ